VDRGPRRQPVHGNRRADASLKLIQACGRLLRTEQDRGTITLLDRRLVTQRYGKAILNALPPFRREIG
jgi:ATP-dependent DNA helicase DinG